MVASTKASKLTLVIVKKCTFLSTLYVIQLSAVINAARKQLVYFILSMT